MVQDMLPLCLCLQFAFCYFFGFWSQGELDRKSNFPIIYTPTIIPDSSAYVYLLSLGLKVLVLGRTLYLLGDRVESRAQCKTGGKTGKTNVRHHNPTRQS